VEVMGLHSLTIRFALTSDVGQLIIGVLSLHS